MLHANLPKAAGVSFKPEHFPDIRTTRPPIGFFEVHAENYMGDGGRPHAQLAALRQDYALSIHGVGLSIGAAAPLDTAHLARLRRLCDRYEPESFSEHLAWSSHDDGFLNDLLPLPYMEDSLSSVCQHIHQVQDVLGRQMLLENPSTYVLFAQSTMSETEFLREVVRQTGCGLLLDVNNVFVSATNHRTDPQAYLADFPLQAVRQIHLGGHSTENLPTGPLLIDSHGSATDDAVWALYAGVIARIGPCATLIEWDNDVPEFKVLLQDAVRATGILHRKDGSYARAS
jgi:uncharacterized protein